MPASPAPSFSRPALFLDRDGVVCEDIGYLADPEELRLFTGAAAAIRRLNAARVPVVIVTNQSGVARGLLGEPRLAEIHEALAAMLAAQGARLDGLYYCPHHPTSGAGAYTTECDCRKPKPGMLLRAAQELGLDLGRSALIGDKLSDIATARAAGCAAATLVLTGHGVAEADRIGEQARPDHIAPAIGEALDWLAESGLIVA